LKYPTRKALFVDVDGTLVINGKANVELVEAIRTRHKNGFTITVWSARGEANSKRAVELCGIGDVVSHTISKPTFVVDDKGWGWIKHAPSLTVEQAKGCY